MGELVETWRAWGNGQDVSQNQLWFMGIFWWGRVGLSLELFGGLTMLADVITSPRLRSFAGSLRSGISLERSRDLSLFCFEMVRNFFVVLFTTKSFYKAINRLGVAGVLITTGLILASTVAGAFVFMYFFDGALMVILGSVIAFVSGVIIGPSILFLIGTVLFIVMLLFYVPIFAASLVLDIERKYLKKSIEIAAITSILSGFHFDLLAS